MKKELFRALRNGSFIIENNGNVLIYPDLIFAVYHPYISRAAELGYESAYGYPVYSYDAGKFLLSIGHFYGCPFTVLDIVRI